MRIKIGLASLLLCMLFTVHAKNRVIERPSFLASLIWNSTRIEIDKIVINDTSTIVSIKAFCTTQHWIRIAKGSFLKDKNGQLYPIRYGIGITLDENLQLPASGEVNFQMVFPPLPPHITCIDFAEGEFDGSYKIWDIQLDKKEAQKHYRQKELPLSKIDTRMTLPEPINKNAKAIIKGQILDFKEGMPTNGSIYLNDVIRGVMVEKKFKIQADGTFYKEVEAFTVTPANITLLQQNMFSCLLAPGEITSVTINLREYTRQQSKLHQQDKPYGKPFYFSGYLGSLQQELSDCKLSIDFYEGDLRQAMKVLNGKSPEQYKADILLQFHKFSKQIAQSPYSPACKEILTMKIDYSVASFIAGAERFLKHAYIIEHQLSDEEALKYWTETKIKVPDDYYQTVKELSMLNSPKACYISQFSQLVYSMATMNDIEKAIQKGLETDKGYLFDCVNTLRIGTSIQDFKPLNDEQKAQLAHLPLSYTHLIEVMNNNLLRKIESNKKKTGYTIHEIEQVSNEKLFSSILSKFQGQVLLVDFWATWCGPCRVANRAIIPLKKALKDKEIVYLYITGETSPMEIWQKMISDIHGEHFRVTNDQWNYLITNFNIHGIPAYFVIDPNGNITFRETGFPGIDIMKKELIKALEK